MPLFEGMWRQKSRLWPERDQFLLALHLLADKARTKPPTWTVAVMQIHMDIHDVARSGFEQEISIWQEMLSSDLERLKALRKMQDERLRLPRKMQAQIEDDDTEVEKDLVALSEDPYDVLNLEESASEKSQRRFAMYKAFQASPASTSSTRQWACTIVAAYTATSVNCCCPRRIFTGQRSKQAQYTIDGKIWSLSSLHRARSTLMC